MAARIFISYSHADHQMLGRLHKHLAQLERDNSIEGWFDREIQAGSRFDENISRELERSDVFLACASPDYLGSTYCIDVELKRALERESRHEMIIVPVIFEHCEWKETDLNQFKAVPTDGKSVSEHTNYNIAFLDVVTEIRRLVSSRTVETKSAVATSRPRPDSTSRYRIKRDHDELHKRDFIEASFAEIFRFFEASAQEISVVPEIEVRLSPRSEFHFSCTVINRGLNRGFETIHIRRGGSWGAIDVLFGEKNSTSTSNGGFSVEADEYDLFLRPSMMSMRSSSERERISAREAAQMLWDDLLKKVGVDYA